MWYYRHAVETSLLATKLYVPRPRSNLVERRRLIERLDEGLRLGRRMTLVSAAAGSGKTTLLGAWIAGVMRASPQGAAWLSLDEEDSDPARFWTYIAAALQTVRPCLGRTLSTMLQGSQPIPVRSVLTPLINEAAALSEHVILVLEDYHLITEQAVHEGVAFLLDRLPRQLHLVISTRADPPLPIARLRARGELAELREADLRFTAEETAAFLNGVMKLGLRSEEVAALETRTEGWIAGLNLAALSLRGRGDARAFIEAFTGSHRYILEYLIEEVLSRQPQPVQSFLMRTSILDRLCAPLCDAVTGEHDGAEMVERLRRDNLFIVPLDGERRWYRYHHLFGDLLRKRLGETAPPDLILELHRRAGRWHEDNGLFEKAVKHAQEARDAARVADLAERAAGAGLLDARLTTLLRWVDALSEDVLRAHPRLQVYRAWALYMNGHLEAARQAFDDCRHALEILPPSPENDALRSELTRLLDTIDMIARGFMFGFDNKIEAAIRVCGRARDMALEDNRVFLAAQATEGLALAFYHQGRLRASAQSCRQVIEMAEQGAAQTPLAAAGYVELAGIHTEWNDLKSAADLLGKALELCRQWGFVQTLNEAYVARSRLLQAGGDVKGAWDALGKAREAGAMEGDRSLVNFRLDTQRANLNLRGGEPDKVLQWIEEIMAAHPSGGRGRQSPAVIVETLQTMLARAYLAKGKAEKALSILDPLRDPAKGVGGLRVIEVFALRALALSAVGDPSAALASLERSLTLAEPESFVRMFLDEGPPMAALMREAASRGIAPDYVGALRAAFATKEAGVSALSDPLSPRELDVLLLISDGLSNKEIAEKLFVAVNTVKRHTSSIFGKLGVKSRARAAARAREIGLLPAHPDGIA